MFQLHIRILAREDILHIIDYYEDKAPHVTDAFLENLYAEFDVIAENPELFHKKYRQTRVRYTKGFPFGIHYIIKGDIVEVLAILHTSRNPDIWKKR